MTPTAPPELLERLPDPHRAPLQPGTRGLARRAMPRSSTTLRRPRRWESSHDPRATDRRGHDLGPSGGTREVIGRLCADQAGLLQHVGAAGVGREISFESVLAEQDALGRELNPAITAETAVQNDAQVLGSESPAYPGSPGCNMTDLRDLHLVPRPHAHEQEPGCTVARWVHMVSRFPDATAIRAGWAADSRSGSSEEYSIDE